VPGLPDFKLQRVLGQGGFGQVRLRLRVRVRDRLRAGARGGNPNPNPKPNPEPNPDQVLEVVKRDCGKHYAMKVTHKAILTLTLTLTLS